jgi:protein SDA1
MLIELMESHAQVLHGDVRAKLFQALVTLRNKTMIEPLLLLRLCFHLFTVNDKTMRASLSQYIFNDIKNINIKRHDEKTNKNIQALLFKVVSEDTTITARKSVEILANLYRRRIWTDERTVNVLGEACRSKSTRVLTAALHFFLGTPINTLPKYCT